MDHLVETLEEATVQVQGKHQQQLVRERGQRIKAAAELGLQARSSRGRALGGRGRGGVVVPPTQEEAASTGNEPRQLARPRSAAPMEKGGDDGEEEEVDEKVALLRQLVPGDEGMPVEGLLEETAGYIAALKAQVRVMRALACLLSGSSAGTGLDALIALPEEPAGVLTTEKPV